MSISGVQMKLSVKLDKQIRQVQSSDVGGTYLLKPEPQSFPELPQNENLCMNLARMSGLKMPAHGLFPMKDGNLCYIVKRFDRGARGEKIHKENMAQILAVPSEEKYSSSLEKVGKAIERHVKNTGLDLLEFFERVLFCYLIGNGDMHLKNWSLLNESDGTWSLSPCYDMVCSKMYIPEEDETALTLNGKKNKLTLRDFVVLANHLKIAPKAAERTCQKYLSREDEIIDFVDKSELSAGRKQQMKSLITERLRLLQK